MESAATVLMAALALTQGSYTKVVTIPPGVYLHDHLIKVVNLSDTTIIANGVTFLIPADPLIDCSPAWIKLVNPHNVRITGLEIIDLGSDSSACPEQTHGITTRFGSHVTLDNLHISGVGDECVQFGSTEYTRLLDSRLDGCVRESSAWAGSVVIAGADHSRISGNVITDNLTSEELASKSIKGHGVRLEASDQYGSKIQGVIITGNQFARLSAGVVISVSDDVDGVIIDQNTFKQVNVPIIIRTWGKAQITQVVQGDNIVLRE